MQSCYIKLIEDSVYQHYLLEDLEAHRIDVIVLQDHEICLNLARMISMRGMKTSRRRCP